MAHQALRLSDIQIRDPFILTVEEEGAYYLFGSTDPDPWNPPGTGFDCYRSTDLNTWEGPTAAFRAPVGFWADRHFWAPEVHPHNGRYVMFASFKAPGVARGTQVLVADRPDGPYEVWSDGPVTPREWESLDGTLFIDDDGDPWLVFCHEWTQIVDGAIAVRRLSADLREGVGAPSTLFHASEADWTRPAEHPSVPAGQKAYVTDGPFVQRLPSGTLIMLWSSFGERGYAMGLARSLSGLITGPWEQQAEPIWARDGGHGMIAQTLRGDLLMVFHQPNETPHERTVLRPLEQLPDTLREADAP